MKTKGKIFLLDDDELIVSALSRLLKKSGYEVRTATSADNAAETILSWSPHVVLLDVRLPQRSGIDILQDLIAQGVPSQIVMLTADDTAETAVKAMKLGAADYITKPFNTEEVKIMLRNLMEKARLLEEVTYLRKVNAELFEQEIIGTSGAIRDIKAEIEKIARASVSTLLITGESGTGKELFARYAHRLMRRPGGPEFMPFVQINCASLPDTLLESELFGHEKGAFTDAKTEKKGLFELAEGGSILLDERGEMRPNLQATLLRVLEERTLRRVGGSEEIPFDITVISTTNKNLDEAVKQGDFRGDLLFRLNTFHLHIPPLRERREDVPLLARSFLSFFAEEYNKKSLNRFSPEAEALFTAYDWPGNVRELRNLVERIVVLESTEEVRREHLPDWLVHQGGIRLELRSGFLLPETGVSLEALEKDLIRQALDRTNYNKTQAAKLLEISYDTLRYQVKKFGLE